MDMQRYKKRKIANFSVDSILLHMSKKAMYFILRQKCVMSLLHAWNKLTNRNVFNFVF
jgi:hypothetical protein